MYGHTHRPFYEVDKKDGDKDLIVLNPGSLSYPRQDGHRPSYMLMDIDRDGEALLTELSGEVKVPWPEVAAEKEGF